MLRRFELVKNCGIFESFRWNADSDDFQRINLIFGTNGSGKSSLARALDALTGDGGGHEKVSIRLNDPDGTNDRPTNHLTDEEFKRIVVFGDTYVSRSHRFEGSTEMDAVLTLGEKTVEAEARISELQASIETSQGERAVAQGAISKGERDLERAYTALRNTVVSDLSRAGGDYTSNSTYGQRIRARFSGSHADWDLLSEVELASNKQIVVSDSRLEVPDRTYAMVVRPELQREAQEQLGTSPVSIVLDTLETHPQASSWVDDGRHQHHGIDTCIFCGSALSDERKRQIEAHFSDEVTNSQRSLDRLIGELDALQRQLERLLSAAPDAGLLFEDLREEYEVRYADVQRQAELLQDWTRPALEALRAKRENVLEKSDFVVSDPPSVDGSELQSSIKVHNERVANHSSLVQEAARRVERHHLKSAEKNVEELESSNTGAKEKRNACDNDLRRYREEVASLEAVEGDPLPSARTLTLEVARLLGRSELVFELAPGGSKYLVMRHGQPAADLSTGERRAITLVHFFESVRNADIQGRPIVVIDDPVSSLDSDVATGISSYIWNEVVVKDHIEQVFMLTHSFDLFKQWDFQIDGLHRNSALRRAFPAERYELVAPHIVVGGVTRRVPKFLKWPPNDDARRKLRSTYHHAFIMVARAGVALREDDSVEHRLDGLLLYPNVIRRMLESFLAFKRPELIGNFADTMRASGSMLTEAGYEGDAELIRLRLTRFTNTHSHDESPETDITLNPDEIGPTITAAFTFMHALDSQHFDGLCEIVGIEPNDLLLEIDTATAAVDDGTLFPVAPAGQ
jgi:wobble nucleotide-excising tRNase